MDNIVEIVDKLQQLGLLRMTKVSGKYYQGYCPIHSSGQEKKPSFGILLEEEVKGGQRYPAGFSHCFSCGLACSLSTLVDKIIQERHISDTNVIAQAKKLVGSTTSVDYDHLIPNEVSGAVLSKFAANYVKELTRGPSISYVTEEELQKYRYTVPYMYERHLTDAVIEQYDIGYQADWLPPGKKKPVPCITFPVRDAQGRTLFFCRRSIQGKLYNYPENVTKPLYGVDMIPQGCKSLLVCESCINALTAVTWGYTAVALMGTGNSYQIQQLKELGIPEITLCLDGDDAGRRASKKLQRELRSSCIVWTVNMIDGKDVNDIDKQTFDRLYLERE